MKKVVVLSDTHGLLRPQVLECLEGADLMVHAGDINTQAVVDQLASYGPLQVVRGNNDKERSVIWPYASIRKRLC